LRTPPEGLGQDRLVAALTDHLGAGLQAEYLPVGGGSHHWRVIDGDGTSYFVTVDDLDQKPYLGPDADPAFEGLRHALDTAFALRNDSGLDFVVCPLRFATGETVRRLDSRYAVAVYPFIDGPPATFGETFPTEERAELIRMLAMLHRSTPLVDHVARTVSLRLPGRGDLERALHDVDQPWEGGPLSETAREHMRRHAAGVRRRLETFDQLVERVEAGTGSRVITHGETHGGNVLHSEGKLLLIDWDTTGIAPPERDLWMVEAGEGDELKLYEEESGRQVDEDAIALYRIRWPLDDIASFVADLRSPHELTADTEHALKALLISLEMDDRLA
jgi:spectinomycin phosphotransferase